MLTLDLTNAPRWNDLAPGVRAQLRPLTTALMVATRSDPVVEAVREEASDAATAELQAQLPAVVSVADEFADPRYPNFKGLMAAKKKELRTVTLAELGVDPEDFTHPRAIMTSIERRPERERGEIIDANSTAAARLVDFLESKNLI